MLEKFGIKMTKNLIKKMFNFAFYIADLRANGQYPFPHKYSYFLYGYNRRKIVFSAFSIPVGIQMHI